MPAPIKLLVIDSNSSDTETVTQQLQQNPDNEYEIDFADSGQAGLQQCIMSPPNCVLLSYQLNDIDGLTLLSKLHELPHLRHIPVIVLIEKQDTHLALQAMRHGASDYLFKTSLSGNEITKVVLNAIEKKQLFLKLQEQTLALKYMVSHDQLTRLPNRQAYETELSKYIELAEHQGESFGLVYFCVDHLTHINSSFGQQTGDLLLQEIAQRALGVIRKYDFLARIGNEQFALCLGRLNEIDDIALIMKKLTETISQQFTIDNQNLHVSISLGATVFPDQVSEKERLMSASELAMAQAKKNPGTSYYLYTSDMERQQNYQTRVEQALYHATEHKNFELDYLPVVELRTGKIVGLEALVRINDPHLGIIMPNDFITIAEQSNAIQNLGQWVMHEVCVQYQTWNDRVDKEFYLSINISPYQLANTDFYSSLVNNISTFGINPDYLHLELTEAAIIKHADIGIDAIRKLKNLGIHITIDDFGTGSSSLAQLKELPVEILKIDGTFIDDIEVDGGVLVKTIIDLARNLNLTVIAEQVKTETQAEFLLANGCKYAQGFYFHKPLSAHKITKLLSN